MTPSQADMLFISGLGTIGILKRLVVEKYQLSSIKDCRVYATRKSGMVDMEDTFILRPDDCVRVMVISKEEIKFYRHGSAREVLLNLGTLTPNAISATVCPKCKQF